MKNKFLKFKALFIGIFLFCLFFAPSIKAAGDTNFQIQILAICGNEIQEWNEDCDGEDLGSGTCINEGFNSGIITCNEDCTFNTSECAIILPPPTTNSDNTGGGGGMILSTPMVTQTTVFFSGLAYPGGKVVLLKDAQPAATTVAGPDAKFSFSLSGLSGGNYIFSLYAEDLSGFSSSLLTFSANLSSKTMTEINGAFLSPSVSIDKMEVKRGESVIISGQTAPNAEVTAVVVSIETIYKKTRADITGSYTIIFDTEALEETQYFVKSQATYGGMTSIYSRASSFTVSQADIFREDEKEWLRGDLNEDVRVNLVDFSIGAFWYKKTLNEKITIKENQVLNGDKKIDLVDFSIMAYNWTG